MPHAPIVPYPYGSIVRRNVETRNENTESVVAFLGLGHEPGTAGILTPEGERMDVPLSELREMVADPDTVLRAFMSHTRPAQELAVRQEGDGFVAVAKVGPLGVEEVGPLATTPVEAVGKAVHHFGLLPVEVQQ